MNPSTTTMTTDSEFDLDISFIASGLTASGSESEDCTSDGCGGTEDSAGTTC